MAVVERVKRTGGHGSTAFDQVVTKGEKSLMQQKKQGGVVHSFAQEECAAIIEFINSKLAHDPKLAYLLPMAESTLKRKLF